MRNFIASKYLKSFWHFKVNYVSILKSSCVEILMVSLLGK